MTFKLPKDITRAELLALHEELTRLLVMSSVDEVWCKYHAMQTVVTRRLQKEKVLN